MSWKDRLQKGSFRGVPFYTDSTDAEIGRRVVLHEYPLRDKPYAEDLGKKAENIPMEVFVLGQDYMDARDRLMEALNASGPGTLVHPFRGTMQAVVMSARGPRESTREGGMARFSVTFVEAGENSFPTAETDTRTDVHNRADSALIQSQKAFDSGTNILDKPDSVEKEAVKSIEQAAETMSRSRRWFPGVMGESAGFAREVDQFLQSVESTVRTSSAIAEGLTGLVVNIKGTVQDPAHAVDMYEQVYKVFSINMAPQASTSMSASQVIGNNQQVLNRLMATSALVEAIRTSTDVDFDSYNQASGLRDRLCEYLDEVMLTAPDEVYASLGALRTSLVHDINARAADLSRVVSHTPKATLPALVIAHRLYSDATKAEDILDRNNVRHPGFVPGGVDLEVLSRA